MDYEEKCLLIDVKTCPENCIVKALLKSSPELLTQDYGLSTFEEAMNNAFKLYGPLKHTDIVAIWLDIAEYAYNNINEQSEEYDNRRTKILRNICQRQQR